MLELSSASTIEKILAMVYLVVYPLLLGQINKILWSAAISCVCSKQSLTAPDEFLATTMDDVQVCWCCYWDVDPDVSEAYLMELFLQIFSGRNLRWLHSSVNLRNIFSPSELSNNVGYCCFDSSLVRGSVMPLYSSAICERKFCSFAGIGLFARFFYTPRYWFCTCICNCPVDYEESPMQMLCFTTLLFW